MLDLVSVLGGTMRTEDLPDFAFEAWFARRAARPASTGGSRTLRTVLARVWRRSWLFYGICAVVAGTTLLKRA